ncbi:MAG: TolC family protein [Acidobacteriota bacterium]|nr:TolC family protein [Acidobacteriota bacterium]
MKRLALLLLCAQPLFAMDFNDPRALAAAAVDAHPAMARLRAEAAAARERIASSDALPNPMLMSGVQNKQVDLRDDPMMTMYMAGVSQTLVRPEKREARRNAAELMARAAEKQIDATRAEIERDVFLAWYDLAAADMQLSAVTRVRELLSAVVDAARVRYEVGTSMQADVIRAQLEASSLEHEVIELRGMRRAALARLLPLLDLPLATDVPSLAFPEHAGSGTTGTSIAVPDDHPAIAAMQAEAAAAEADIRMVELERTPDIELEAQYGYRRIERDMFSLTARIELPLRAKTNIEPRVREAIARRDVANARIAELRRSISAALAQFVVAHEEATNQLRFHHDVLVPQAQLAFESSLTAYQTGRTALDAVLAAEAAYLRLQLEAIRFVAEHEQAVASYDALRRGARPGAGFSTGSMQ